MLKDVLYFPDFGYMLISLAKCDTAGFTVTLKDKSCCIKDAKWLQIGWISQYQGLYQVDNGTSANIGAYMEVRVHTVDELHWKMDGPHLTSSYQTTNQTESHSGTWIMLLYHINYPKNTLKTLQKSQHNCRLSPPPQDQLPCPYDILPCHTPQSKHIQMHICTYISPWITRTPYPHCHIMDMTPCSINHISPSIRYS